MTAVGSSTALIGVLNKRSLSFANLGDSGFVYYRQQECKIVDDRQVIGETYLNTRSKEQVHSFNTPYQLSILPNEEHIEQLKSRGKI